MKRRLLLLFSGVLILALTLSGCGESNTGEQVNLTVSAAASLQDAAKEIQEAYTGVNPNVKITYNFAASGTLQKQIEQGAPVDLFISAGTPQMDALSEKGLIFEDTRQNLLSNDLVLIAAEDSPLTGFDELTGNQVTKISIGTPESVPAGRYAQEALVSMGLWDTIQPKLVLAKDVRQVLTYVETGNVDAGLVYHSDALMGDGIKVVAAAPEGTHEPVVYPMAIINSTQNREAVEAFIDFLTGPEASEIFAGYGFKTLKD